MKYKKSSGKRASIVDVLGLIIFIPIIIVLILGVGMAYMESSDALEDSKDRIGINYYNESVDTFNDQASKFSSFWDFGIIFIVFGIWIVMFMSAWILGTNPIFLAVYIVIALMLIVVATVIGIAMLDFATHATIETYLINYPMTLYLLRYMAVFDMFFIVSIGVALYLKSRT